MQFDFCEDRLIPRIIPIRQAWFLLGFVLIICRVCTLHDPFFQNSHFRRSPSLYWIYAQSIYWMVVLTVSSIWRIIFILGDHIWKGNVSALAKPERCYHHDIGCDIFMVSVSWTNISAHFYNIAHARKLKTIDVKTYLYLLTVIMRRSFG